MNERSSTRRARRQAVGVFLALWALLSLGSYFLLVVPRQNRFDLYHCWVGARTVLAGETPYSQAVVRRIHEGMFGQWSGQEAVQQRFAYPAIVTWILLPLWLLPFPFAVSLWCGLQLLFLLILPLLVASLLQWQLRPISLALLLLCSALLYRYSLVAYVLGQFTLFSLACLVAAWWGLAQNRPVVATLALLGATVRPEVASFPMLVLLLEMWRTGHRKAVASWAGAVLCLCLLTRLWSGPWVLDFLSGMRDYAATSYLRWPPLVMGSVEAAVLLTAVTLAWGGWMWSRFSHLPLEVRLPLEISAALLVALIVLPQTNTYTLVAALLPTWVVLWGSGGRWIGWLSSLVILSLPWGFYGLGGLVPAGLEQLLIPLALAVLLSFWWHRRRIEWKGDGT